ncbi:MAG: ribbon-helix-helix protein, CopG family [Anaerolineae bacterium]|nr:ribbon-helix-helix protein, CopG family [Anaerolineae bacterium]
MSRPATQQHFLYLSAASWGEAKRRAVLEATTASKLLNRLLQAYLEQPMPAPAAHPRQRGSELDLYARRSVHLETTLWQGITARAAAEGRSVSAIAEQLLRAYLGIS